MAVQRTPTTDTLVDVLERILDRGVILRSHIHISLVGIDLKSPVLPVHRAENERYLYYATVVGLFSAAPELQGRAGRHLRARVDAPATHPDPGLVSAGSFPSAPVHSRFAP